MHVRRTKRAFNLVELSVILGILGMLAVAAFSTYAAVTSRSDAETGRHAMRTVMIAQQMRYTQRGAFTDDAADLAALESSWSYVGANTTPPDHTQISVATGLHERLDAVALATTTEEGCLGAVVYPPNIQEPLTGTWTPEPGVPCTATSAFIKAGEETW